MFLKMSKSWFGFSSVKFFGYKVTYGKREMDEDRKKAIMEFRMPTCQKEMQSFLGAALFFKSFVPNYSEIASELNKMTHKDFNWKRESWTYDYESDFERMKKALSECLLHPLEVALVVVCPALTLPIKILVRHLVQLRGDLRVVGNK